MVRELIASTLQARRAGITQVACCGWLTRRLSAAAENA
jgi:hypothetical protein